MLSALRMAARSRRSGASPGRSPHLPSADAELRVQSLAIGGVKLIVPPLHSDERGWFCEAYSSAALALFNIECAFVQDNISLSRRRGTIRGLHFQRPPHAQAKLVRVSRGRILDVAVDLRRASPTFGAHLLAELSADNRMQLFVPAGFAHGFCTLEPDTEVVYKVSGPFTPAAEAGVHWRDSDIAIDWPIAEAAAVVSVKDAALPRLRELPPYFD